MGGRREARLRPEHARLYPSIPVNAWEAAAVLCEMVRAHPPCDPGADFGPRRILAAEHFEFRDAPEHGLASPASR
jgi:hypothetical protein